MDHRCLFILFSTILYLSIIQCEDTKHHPIDFLKPTNDENLKREEMTTTPKTNSEPEPHGIKKFIVDVKNKFSHLHPVRDVGEILFGSSADKTSTTIATTSITATTESAKSNKPNINKIVESMPSESEDMIRVVTLKKEEHYGKGRAKPKYLSMELEKMNSTDYNESTTLTAATDGKSLIEDFSSKATTTTSAPKSSIEDFSSKATTSTSAPKTSNQNGRDLIKK